MTTALNNSLNDWLLALADDRLVLAHRNSEWTGHAPILEEDIALANIAQDELGHAVMWYTLLAKLKGEGETYPDRLVYQREVKDWRNLQLVELPKGDWAFTMLRQYFMDVYEHLLLAELSQSTNEEISTIAARALREKLYHLRHSTAWVKRLAKGTSESHDRLQRALDELWPYTAQLFVPGAGEEELIASGVIPPKAGATALQTQWESIVRPLLTDGELSVPALVAAGLARSEHTAHLSQLLEDLRKVARLDPEAAW